jgi:hypothetical protein
MEKEKIIAGYEILKKIERNQIAIEHLTETMTVRLLNKYHSPHGEIRLGEGESTYIDDVRLLPEDAEVINSEMIKAISRMKRHFGEQIHKLNIEMEEL